MTDEYRAERVLGVPRVTEFPPHHDLPQRRGYTAYTSAQSEPMQEHSVHDVASVLGLSADAVGSEVLDAVRPLLVELDRLRSAVERGQHTRAYLEREADRHPFLPCLNRRAFLREVDALITAAEGVKTVAVLHVGGIEALRREQGLIATEAVLRHACAMLLGNLRVSDTIGALGGSDFGLLLAGADGAAASAKLAELRVPIENFSWLGKSVPLAVRSGAHTVGAGESAEQALGLADADLISALRRASGDDVGDELVFQPRDVVLES